MRMDPFKILILFSIISSSRVTISAKKWDTDTTCSQRRVIPEAGKKIFLWNKMEGDQWKDRWREEARDWAWERVSRFVRMLQDWGEVQKKDYAENWKLMGGKADVHDKPRWRNPRINNEDRPQYCDTQRAHAVQAKMSTWAPSFFAVVPCQPTGTTAVGQIGRPSQSVAEAFRQLTGRIQMNFGSDEKIPT